MRSHPLLVPASIALAGAFVGAGLYLGLRAPPPPAPTPSGATAAGITVAPLASPGASPAEPVRSPPPGVSPEAQARIDRQTADAFSRDKPRLVKDCWEPSAKASPQPASLTVRVRVLFDGQGKSTQVAVATPEEESRRDVAECIRKSPPSIQVEPTGTQTGTQLSITFP